MTAADWYPDPMGKHEYRYWDGEVWTDQVASHGRQSTSPIVGDPKSVERMQTPESVRAQVSKHHQQAQRRGAPPPPTPASASLPPAPTQDSVAPQSSVPPSSIPASGSLLDQSIVVVNQKTKLIEVNTEFALYNADGNQIGAVRQVGQNALKKVLRFAGDIDQYLTHKFQVVDADGVVQLMVTRPAKFFKSKVHIQDAVGGEVGTVVQQNVFGKIRFAFIVNGQEIGGIFAENWRAWNFSIRDASGAEVARVTKTFEGLLRTAFTNADNYVLQVHSPLPDPLRQMVFAAAVCVDVALKQDARGVGAGTILDAV